MYQVDKRAYTISWGQIWKADGAAAQEVFDMK